MPQRPPQGKASSPPETADLAARREREAEALRENLKKRRSQAVARRTADVPESKEGKD
jgi:hypothetical protein